MKRQVLFVQGAGKDVHGRWDNRLVASLRSELGPDYDIRYPVMPNEADPKYATWKQALERELAALESGAIVIGHSVGGTILINVLAERTPESSLGAICLISAPFIGEGGWESDDIEPQSSTQQQPIRSRERHPAVGFRFDVGIGNARVIQRTRKQQQGSPAKEFRVSRSGRHVVSRAIQYLTSFGTRVFTMIDCDNAVDQHPINSGRVIGGGCIGGASR